MFTMKKMSILFTRNGLMMECFDCKEALTPEQADLHICEEINEQH